MKSGDVVGLGEGAHQDHVLTVGGAAHGLRRAEHDRALGGSGRRRDAGGQHLEVVGGIEDRMKQRLERLGIDRQQCLLAGQQALLHGVDGEADGGLGGALGGAGLKQEETTLLDRELDVLHVLVVGLEPREVAQELRVGLGDVVGQRREVLRVAGAGDDVLALGVGQEVARGGRFSRPLVAAEGDPGARAVAPVSEDHLLDVDRGAPIVGDAVDPAVGDSAPSVPGVEDRGDRLPELLPGLGREGVSASPPRTGRLKVAVSSRSSSAPSSVSALTRLLSFTSCSACSKLEAGIPRTTLPNICTNRR